MRRAHLIPIALLAVALATPSQAATRPGPQLTDPVGDWPVPSMDIGSVTLSTVGTPSRPALQVSLALAAPPAASQPTAYHVSFAFPECERLEVLFQWAGGLPGMTDHAFIDASSCPDASAPVVGSDTTDVPVSLTGKSVTWTIPLTLGIRRGTVLTGLSASTSPGASLTPLGTNVYVGAPAGDSTGVGDDYRVGS